jgi:hypothetical protein
MEETAAQYEVIVILAIPNLSQYTPFFLFFYVSFLEQGHGF